MMVSCGLVAADHSLAYSVMGLVALDCSLLYSVMECIAPDCSLYTPSWGALPWIIPCILCCGMRCPGLFPVNSVMGCIAPDCSPYTLSWSELSRIFPCILRHGVHCPGSFPGININTQIAEFERGNSENNNVDFVMRGSCKAMLVSWGYNVPRLAMAAGYCLSFFISVGLGWSWVLEKGACPGYSVCTHCFHDVYLPCVFCHFVSCRDLSCCMLSRRVICLLCYVTAFCLPMTIYICCAVSAFLCVCQSASAVSCAPVLCVRSVVSAVFIPPCCILPCLCPPCVPRPIASLHVKPAVLCAP